MGYKPTIGGLEQLQEFLDGKGFPLPNFYMGVKGGGLLGSRPDEDISRKMISFDEAKRLYGAVAEVVDVRLANADGSSLIQFSVPTNYGIFTALSANESGMDVVIETHKDDVRLDHFLGSKEGSVFLDIARWGKPEPSFMDRMKFRWRPRSYAQSVFT